MAKKKEIKKEKVNKEDIVQFVKKLLKKNGPAFSKLAHE